MIFFTSQVVVHVSLFFLYFPPFLNLFNHPSIHLSIHLHPSILTRTFTLTFAHSHPRTHRHTDTISPRVFSNHHHVHPYPLPPYLLFLSPFPLGPLGLLFYSVLFLFVPFFVFCRVLLTCLLCFYVNFYSKNQSIKSCNYVQYYKLFFF